jgi:ankyrin repeat protein
MAAAALAAALGGCATPLMKAAGAGNLAQVRALVAQGADANEVNSRAGSPLSYAIDADRGDVVDFLLKHGAQSNSGSLWIAAAFGHTNAFTALIADGADPFGKFKTVGGSMTTREIAESNGRAEIAAVLKQYEDRIFEAGGATVSKADRARIGRSVLANASSNQGAAAPGAPGARARQP